MLHQRPALPRRLTKGPTLSAVDRASRFESISEGFILSQNGNAGQSGEILRDQGVKQVLRRGIEEWLRLYRNDRPNAVELNIIAGNYEAVLPRGMSPLKLRAAMNEAMKRTKFMPTPAELLHASIVSDPQIYVAPSMKPEVVERYLARMDQSSTAPPLPVRPLEEMTHWKPSDPEWPEVKEFIAKLHEVSGR